MADINIVLVTADHWPTSVMGCDGNRAVRTPTLDALAHNGIRFTSAYSTCPVCIPARRSLMTGLSPRAHGDRVYSDRMPMPDSPTLAGEFSRAGYQTNAVGKLHVFPQRARIGFDEVVLCEEARYELGGNDDYELWLAEHGFAGLEYAHGMSNNEYFTRPWHLPERAHNTNWTTEQAVYQLRRRDPTRPQFLYVSYIHPHPPLVPLQCYLDMYAGEELPPPARGEWDGSGNPAIAALRSKTAGDQPVYGAREINDALRAFYAQCTHIDNQLRLIIGALREEKLLDDTVFVFASDHGDMLFDHGMTGKRVFYENSAHIPLLMCGKPLEKLCPELVGGACGRLACLEDVMPTLLGLAGIPVPQTVEGLDLLRGAPRELLFGEISDGALATRMATDGARKLIYYPNGNLTQLFDLARDPKELRDVSDEPEYAALRERLERFLAEKLHGGDEAWVGADGKLAGTAPEQAAPRRDYGLNNQRGIHFPPVTAK